MGHGQGYLYPHDHPGHYVKQDYLPPGLTNKKFYTPAGQGEEIKIKQYLERIMPERYGAKKNSKPEAADE
jgi:putative ATPase